MSYLKTIEYEIILKKSFGVIRNCPKCGRKTHFKNTKKFRVNANGNKLDIWLIYQCEACKHTLNLAIYERQKVSSIPKEEYQQFLDNNAQFAETVGKSIPLFRRNKADIDFDRIDYELVKLHETTGCGKLDGQILITVNNPYGLKIRPEKQIAMVLGISRSQAKHLLDNGEAEIKTQLPQSISISINSCHLPTDQI